MLPRAILFDLDGTILSAYGHDPVGLRPATDSTVRPDRIIRRLTELLPNAA